MAFALTQLRPFRDETLGPTVHAFLSVGRGPLGRTISF